MSETVTCYRCRQALPTTAFDPRTWPRRDGPHGLRRICRTCYAAWDRARARTVLLRLRLAGVRVTHLAVRAGLTPRDVVLLERLRATDTLVSAGELAEAMGCPPTAVSTAVYWLRKRLTRAGADAPIETVVGVGYRWKGSTGKGVSHRTERAIVIDLKGVGKA